MLNSLASGRRLALRLVLLQLAVALMVGLAFLPLGRREAAAAAGGAMMVALGTAMLSLRFFSGPVGAGMALSRLLTGMILKWVVMAGGLYVLLARWQMPGLAVLAGMATAMAVNLMALRFKDQA